MKVVKSLKTPDLLMIGIPEINENEAKKGGFIGMLLGALSFSLFENLLAGKCVIRSGEGAIKAGQDFIKWILSDINRYHQMESKFNGVD